MHFVRRFPVAIGYTIFVFLALILLAIAFAVITDQMAPGDPLR